MSSTDALQLDQKLRREAVKYELEVERKKLGDEVRVKIQRMNQIDAQLKALENVEVIDG